MGDLISKESFELIEQDTLSEIVSYQPELLPMIQEVCNFLPELNRSVGLYGKTQSQFMDKNLTVTQLTPIRRLRQITAESTKSMNALREAHTKRNKVKAEIAILERDLLNEVDDLKADLIEAEIDIKQNELITGQPYISGAIKKVANYQKEYNEITDHFSLCDYTEADFEAEEEKYHIMTAFNQGMIAARSRGGMTIDEGNMIYLTQLGINGASATFQVQAYLAKEREVFVEGKEPSNAMYLNWLNDMAAKYKGCSKLMNEFKGMNLGLNKEFTIYKGEI